MGNSLSSAVNPSVRLVGKTAVITGANTGIGKCTAKDFYERGARVILACRDVERGTKAVDDIKEQCKGKENLGQLSLVKLDLSSLKSVRDCAKNLKEKEDKINLLINNAGVMMIQELTKTEDGNEMQLGTNHLGHFLFTLLLLPKIVESAPARIVNVSSRIHWFTNNLHIDDLNYNKRRYNPTQAYIQSKLCNILFTKELARRIRENNIQGVTVYSLHPGVIATELKRHIKVPMRSVLRRFIKTPEQGAQTTIYCAVDDKCGKESGLYYINCRPSKSSWVSQNDSLAKKLWESSLKLVGLTDDYDPFKK